VQDVRHQHQGLLDRIDEARRVDALCELNVLEQARNVCHTTVVQDAWARGQSVVVHGWVYGLHNGLLEDLRMTVTGAEDVTTAHAAALAGITARYAGSVATPC
jgi:carbonic anhydrase